MNVQLNPKPVTVHKVVETKGKAIIVACGKWLDRARFTETSTEVTCPRCLSYLGSVGTSSREQSI